MTLGNPEDTKEWTFKMYLKPWIHYGWKNLYVKFDKDYDYVKTSLVNTLKN